MKRPLIILIYVALFCLLMAACAPVPVKPEQPVVPEKASVRIQESLLAPCAPLPRPVSLRPDGSLTEGEALLWVRAMVSAYEACSDSHASLSNTIRKAFNVQTPNPQP